ncbi:TetR/AcrR family transcriptional regulator, partial [Streptomyces lasiicapitis]|uniref:TetR/AcrR family transcriptional regulator n=1 Tax=Streptomyces lasiicapitis TaxID=1923961 RepID=UPI0036904650
METATVAQRRTTRPRADALRNRERIVTAAREMFVEQGPEAPLDEIARRAGVGNATVYRHFPDRGELVHHVVLSVTDRGGGGGGAGGGVPGARPPGAAERARAGRA